MYTQQELQGRCPQCESPNLTRDPERGEVYCRECGSVIQEQIFDPRPEWRAFTPEETIAKARAEYPVSSPVRYRGSSVGLKGTKDVRGRRLSSELRLRMWRLYRADLRSRARSSKTRNLIKALNELSRICDYLHLPRSIRDAAARIYRRALEEGLIRGRSISLIAATSLYTACRFSELPISIGEIAEASLRKKKDIARCYLLLISKLNLKPPLDKPSKHVEKITYKLEVSRKVKLKALETLHLIEEDPVVVGKSPKALAAAAVYLACLEHGEERSQKHVAYTADVTEVTLRKRVKLVRRLLNLRRETSTR